MKESRKRNSLGTATITPRRGIVAGTRQTFTITYVAGPRGIAQSGGVRLITPGSHQWSNAQVFSRAHLPGYVTALPDDGSVQLSVHNIACGYAQDFGKPVSHSEYLPLSNSGNFSGVEIKVARGRIRPRGRIRIVFGDLMGGKGHGAVVTNKVVRARKNLDTFLLWCDARGNGNYQPLSRSPEIEVIPDATHDLEVIVPSIVRRGERACAHVKARDRFCNPTPIFRGRLRVHGPHGEVSVGFVSRNGAQKFKVPVLNGNRITRIEVIGPDNIRGCSNPIQTQDRGNALKVFWGDLHHHSSLSDDNERVTRMFAAPSDTCAYARDVAALDFISVTDHHNSYKPWYLPLIEEAWRESNNCAARMTRLGRFSVFPAMEYRCSRGDTVVLCKDPGEVYCPPEIDTIRKVWDLYRGRNVLSIPHFHPQCGTPELWTAHDPLIERLIEVASTHGNYEYRGNYPLHPCSMKTDVDNIGYQLSLGKRLGITCGSDNHMGNPGDHHLTAVLATENTRDAIFEALRTRRCYGTTHARILLSFRVNQAAMGSEIGVVMGENVDVCAEIHGTAPILSVDLIRNNSVVRSLHNQKADCLLEFSSRKNRQPTDFYYIRVLQADGQMAWSSPVWVDLAPRKQGR